MPDYSINTEDDHTGQVETEHNGVPYDVRYCSHMIAMVDHSERNITITAVVNCNTMQHIDPTTATARTVIRKVMPTILEQEKKILEELGEF